MNRVIEGDGRIDVLINNAGFGLYGPIEDLPIDDARYQFEVNIFGLAHLTKLVLPHMRAQGSGRIVNVSSMVGKVYTPLAAWYDATKHALEGWSDCLRYETAPFGIQVVLIEPGAIKTEFDDVRTRPAGDSSPPTRCTAARSTRSSMLVDDPPDLDRQTPAAKWSPGCTPRPQPPAGPGGDTSQASTHGHGCFVRRWLGDEAFELPSCAAPTGEGGPAPERTPEREQCNGQGGADHRRIRRHRARGGDPHGPQGPHRVRRRPAGWIGWPS